MLNIRNFKKEDKEKVIEMMQVFYASPAVLSNGSKEIFKNDFDACLNVNNPFIEGFVFEEDNQIKGYAMLAKSFSTEFGKPCVWIEDIYIKESFRGEGIGTQFFKFLENKFSNCVFRLEVEEENKGAFNLYKKRGFKVLPYLEMIKL